MDKKLIQISKEYLEKAEQAKNLMLQGLMLKNKEDLFFFRSTMPKGDFYIDYMKHSFCFHGRGLRFSNEYLPSESESVRTNKCLNIDMEFGFGEIWCEMDPWMIFRYIEVYYPELKEKYNGVEIKKTI